METNNNNMNFEQGSVKSQAKSGVITAIMIVIALVTGYVATALLFFNSHFTPGTIINGIDCSAKNVEKVAAEMGFSATNYTLTLTDGEKTSETLSSDEMGLRFSGAEEINNLIDNQNPMLWGLGFVAKKDFNIDNVYSCNDEVLAQSLNSLDIVVNQQNTPPQPATLYFNGEQYEIIEGEHGGRIVMDNLKNAVENAAKTLTPTVNLIENECYEVSEFNANSQKVIDACKQANEYIKPTITMNMGPGAEHIIIDKQLINKWLFVSEDYNVYFDRNKVREYVAEFAKTFNTYGQTREFLTAFGTRTTVKGGDFGWLVDQEKEVQSLVNVIKAGQDVVRYPIYSVMGVGHGNDDVGSSYIEVDLTNQHIYVWIEGKRVLDAPCVTGLPISSRITPPGTYRIKNKLSPAILVGDDYRTPVSYWIPFNRGIGLHDATWQRRFGGNVYRTNGSHGCVNLSLSTAKQVYNYAYIGMPVICYHTKEVGVGKMTVLPDFSTTTTTTTTESTTETTTVSTTVTTTQAATTQTTTKVKPVTQTTTKAQPVTQPTTKKQVTTVAPTTQTTTVVIEPSTVTTTQAPVTTQTTTQAVIIEQTVETTTKKQSGDFIFEPVVDGTVITEIIVE